MSVSQKWKTGLPCELYLSVYELHACFCLAVKNELINNLDNCLSYYNCSIA